jgi:hypothetical protein
MVQTIEVTGKANNKKPEFFNNGFQFRAKINIKQWEEKKKISLKFWDGRRN